MTLWVRIEVYGFGRSMVGDTVRYENQSAVEYVEKEDEPSVVYLCSVKTVRMMCSYFISVCRTSVSAQFRIRLILESLFIRYQTPLPLL